MVDHHLTLHSVLSRSLLKYLSAQPLYDLCREQIADACHMIDQCWLRIHRDDIDRDLASMCIHTSIHEETIFQYASTDTRGRLAHWVRQYSKHESASERDAHTAYIMACAIKALGTLANWMQTVDQEAWSHASAPPTDWPRDLYRQFVEMQVDPNIRIDALDQYALYLEPITSLPCLRDDELRPIADRAIKNAIRKKGGIISSMQRSEETNARDAAIVKQSRHYLSAGMSERNVATAVHAWLTREVAKPPKQRPEWVTLETEKALTRKSIEAILKRNFVV
ncbi:MULTISPECIES: hypothetical protein [unclassified Pseudomonas]|uniref:hypothetical protein n=1 Tax=unclassified Pseudomonas TaxID=196821 RepID=UPI000876BBA2|nr:MULTISPECIES: hypothetical protein [unclassified Pseudomonas]SCZ60388.1 hypothetical protein SAMN03159460_01472 [Pseudomonas sp. NFPP17]SDA54350.1 hypothetical protein SAMN03159464_01654 [Pseudomonas sp. NFPP15]SEK82097.1 hypothetical protein SAMN03159324_02137 [Pseudomonas sp. NFPP18]SFA52826.1 hypothetical protein SAMN03159320_01472 [Pseudomonas sp. NFPP13]SFT61702.1 hypothetical protein SAMN03159492_01652 [Pseudomonas sp. NFPP25]